MLTLRAIDSAAPPIHRRSYATRVFVLASLVVTGSSIGCEGRSPVSPSGGGRTPGTAPVLTSISPVLGATDGGASTTIIGTGFKRGVVAAFDGIEIEGRFDTRDTALTTMYIQTPAHAPGPVDLVVRNPDGAFVKSIGAYTYVPAESFDLNGSWAGSAFDGSDRYLEFTIRDSKLVSASCFSALGEEFPLAIPQPGAVSKGEFSFAGAEGVGMTGRIVSASEIIGTMNAGACATMTWRAYPRIE